MKAFRVEVEQWNLAEFATATITGSIDVTAPTAQTAIRRALAKVRKMPKVLKSQPIVVKSVETISTDIN